MMLSRDLVINENLYERLQLENFAATEKTITVAYSYDFDFKDMFEVRGQRRPKRGSGRIVAAGKSIAAKYRGLDGKEMTCRLTFNRQPQTMNSKQASFTFKLKAHQKAEIELAAGHARPASYSSARAKVEREYEQFCRSLASVETDNAAYNKVFAQARKDLFILQEQVGAQTAIDAGLPWYAVPFGRDQLVTALETLQFAPQLSKQVIDFLAAHQGRQLNASTEEAPGRIMHELRRGEMARLKEIPFTPYFGTVDATPLWLVLLSRYCARSGDLEPAREHWPQVEAAIAYLKANSGDHFLRYGGKVGAALSNQAWKDSGFAHV